MECYTGEFGGGNRYNTGLVLSGPLLPTGAFYATWDTQFTKPHVSLIDLGLVKPNEVIKKELLHADIGKLLHEAVVQEDKEFFPNFTDVAMVVPINQCHVHQFETSLVVDDSLSCVDDSGELLPLVKSVPVLEENCTASFCKDKFPDFYNRLYGNEVEHSLCLSQTGMIDGFYTAIILTAEARLQLFGKYTSNLAFYLPYNLCEDYRKRIELVYPSLSVFYGTDDVTAEVLYQLFVSFPFADHHCDYAIGEVTQRFSPVMEKFGDRVVVQVRSFVKTKYKALMASLFPVVHFVYLNSEPEVPMSSMLCSFSFAFCYNTVFKEHAAGDFVAITKAYEMLMVSFNMYQNALGRVLSFRTMVQFINLVSSNKVIRYNLIMLFMFSKFYGIDASFLSPCVTREQCDVSGVIYLLQYDVDTCTTKDISNLDRLCLTNDSGLIDNDWFSDYAIMVANCSTKKLVSWRKGFIDEDKYRWHSGSVLNNTITFGTVSTCFNITDGVIQCETLSKCDFSWLHLYYLYLIVAFFLLVYCFCYRIFVYSRTLRLGRGPNLAIVS